MLRRFVLRPSVLRPIVLPVSERAALALIQACEHADLLCERAASNHAASDRVV